LSKEKGLSSPQKNEKLRRDAVRHRTSLTLTFQDPNVSRYSIAGFQQDDIPDHHFGHLLSLIVPRDLGLLWQR
jgi:hypothetical protein